jgi:hypothetical protein
MLLKGIRNRIDWSQPIPIPIRPAYFMRPNRNSGHPAEALNSTARILARGLCARPSLKRMRQKCARREVEQTMPFSEIKGAWADAHMCGRHPMIIRSCWPGSRHCSGAAFVGHSPGTSRSSAVHAGGCLYFNLMAGVIFLNHYFCSRRQMIVGRKRGTAS